MYSSVKLFCFHLWCLAEFNPFESFFDQVPLWRIIIFTLVSYSSYLAYLRLNSKDYYSLICRICRTWPSSNPALSKVTWSYAVVILLWSNFQLLVTKDGFLNIWKGLTILKIKIKKPSDNFKNSRLSKYSRAKKRETEARKGNNWPTRRSYTERFAKGER